MPTNTVNKSDIIPGRILWLPQYRELPHGHSIRRVSDGAPMGSTAYGHPVVICSIPDRKDSDMVHFHIITSFGGQSLEDRFDARLTDDWEDIQRYLPIEPAQYHPESTRRPTTLGCPRIKMPNGLQMQVDSYINARDEYIIDRRLLNHYWRRYNLPCADYRIDGPSVKKMRNRYKSLAILSQVQQSRPDSVMGGVPIDTESLTSEEHRTGYEAESWIYDAAEASSNLFNEPAPQTHSSANLGFSKVFLCYESAPSCDDNILPHPVTSRRKEERGGISAAISVVIAWIVAFGVWGKRILGWVWLVIRRSEENQANPRGRYLSRRAS